MTKEVIKPVIGYDGLYQISNFGYIISVKRNKKLSTQKINSGYLLINLCKDGGRRAITLHRLVALHFIDNPYNLSQINHKDLNKLNCHADNLEWCTPKENMIHAKNNGCMISQSKRGKLIMANVGTKYGFDNSQLHLIKAVGVIATNISTNKSTHFKSLRLAAKSVNIAHTTLRYRIKHKILTNNNIFELV